MQIQIRHSGYKDGTPEFFIVRGSDFKQHGPVHLTPPEEVTVEGRPESNLRLDLQWYLEKFLELPVAGNLSIAERTEKALKNWGTGCFNALFQGHARDWFQKARDAGLEELTLTIASDAPGVLAWPWEALHSPDDGFLALRCRIERQLSELGDTLPLPKNLPQDCINILLIIARPFGDEDVGFHALSRPMVELAKKNKLPVHVDVLRPPTFEQLQQKLAESPDHYHIVHFDGHGGYGQETLAGSMHMFKGPQGKLAFEDSGATPDFVNAERLSQLLAEHRIPIMVLNACQSAAVDDKAEDAFASVATALLKAGIRSVVAMGYSLYVSGAEYFVPAFYKRLFTTSNVIEAVRAGRKAMYDKPGRVCMLDKCDLQDWLVPVTYQQLETDERILPIIKRDSSAFTESEATNILPQIAQDLGDYGFIGRERAIQALERAIHRQPQGAILIHGMAGMGKTTLAKGFLHWLADTNGLGDGAFWFDFREVRSAEFIINQLVDPLFGTNARAASLEQKINALAEAFKQNAFLLVWDNFESACGIPNTSQKGLLREEDRTALKQLLYKLRGGKSKVLITSRSPEDWLSIQECYRLPLHGLQGEELWTYCNAVVADLNLLIDRNDDYQELMKQLGGNPLAIRAILLRLGEHKAGKLLEELKEQFVGLEGDESTQRIIAALGVFDIDLPESFGPVLQLIGLHERFMDKDYIGAMFKIAETVVPQKVVDHCFLALVTAGLCQHLGQNLYSLHPALRTHLLHKHPANEALQRCFVDFMGGWADALAPKEFYEQRQPFFFHGLNFYHALELSQALSMGTHTAALLQSIAAFMQNRRQYDEADRLFLALAEVRMREDDPQGESAAYHQLGIVAQDRRDVDAAEKWYKKSLEIKEKLGNERGAAETYGQLGQIALMQRDFTTAEISYRKALKIFEKSQDEHRMAIAYHQLGIVAEERRDFDAAEKWYKKSLEIEEKHGNEHGAAITYHQLGIVAKERRDFDAAEKWYKKSLEIKEKLGNEHGAAITYHQLGIVAQERRDFDAAEKWYKKSLEIKEKLGNEHGAASTWAQLGLLARKRGDFLASARNFIKAIELFDKSRDHHTVQQATFDFIRTLHRAGEDLKEEIRNLWSIAGQDVATLVKLEQQIAEEE